jgi:arsenite-transporting ATPase
LRARLADPTRSHFVVVTRAAALPRAESIRLLARLARLGIHSPVVVVNALGAGTCARCRRQRTAEVREVRGLRRDLEATRSRPALVGAPARMPAPNGRAELVAWRRDWRVLT